MKIQSKDVSAEVAQDLALALGHYLGYTDNQRNPRAATAGEINDFVFGPAKQIYLDFVTKRAQLANPVQVAPLDV